METVIKVENLGKKYTIGRSQDRYIALRDVISEKFKNIFNPGRKADNPKTQEIWALKDVSFEIGQGERVGIIGRNGAGKTTLLKIFSRITEPTKGKVSIKGRVASLLEVGTGFHPELTGRENIFLNGAILGMTKEEIKEKFDEIVDFAELEKFIDTPVKRYSSGMFVRLAFAVAAHLEPEILLVDEVLAVGDMPFQKKCLGKMDNIARHGRTVLFVSHNMQAISQLCARAVLLNEGLLVKDGPTQATINTYIAMTSVDEKTDGDLSRPELRDPVSNPNSLFKWRHCSLINSQKQPTSEIRFGEPFEVTFQGYAKKDCENIIVGFGIFSKTAGLIFVSHQIFNGLPDRVQEGISEFHIEINPNLLTPGLYELGIAIEGPGVGEWISNAMQLHVLDVGITPDKTWNSRYQGGVFHYPCKWRLESKI